MEATEAYIAPSGRDEEPSVRKAWTIEECRVIMQRQFRELMNGNSANVTCGCGRTLPVRFAYRCYFCGLWFCPGCARLHFGERPQHAEDILSATGEGEG
jgi:hypothetical protein